MIASFLRRNLHELRPFALAATLALAVGAVAGVIIPALLPEAAHSFGEGISEFVDLARGLSRPELFVFIFLNNTVKALVMMYLGVGFGLVPLVFMFFNGMAIAVIVGGLSLSIGVGTAMTALLPHGLIEITAILLAAAVGLRLGWAFARRLRSQAVPLKAYLTDAWRFFLRLLMPMLLLAAVIETWITPVVMALIHAPSPG